MDLLFGFFTFFLVLYLIYLAHTFFIQTNRQEGMENAAAAEEEETKLKMKKINENPANKGNARKTEDEKPSTGVKNMNPLPNFIEPQPQLQSQHQPQQYHHQIPAQNSQSQQIQNPQSQNQSQQSQNQNLQSQNQNLQSQNQNPPSNTDASVAVENTDSTMVENMDTQEEPFGLLEDERESAANSMSGKYLHKVYVRNTTGYDKAGLGNTKGPIKLIKLMKIPKDKIFKPVIGLFIFINGILNIFNMIIKFINDAIVYSKCAFVLLVNFFIVPCILWYIINLIGTVLYLIPFFFFSLVGVNELVEDYIWGPIYLLDEFIYDITGFHFAHFPDSINKGCYSCPSKFTLMGIPNIGDFFKNSFNFNFDSAIIPNYYA